MFAIFKILFFNCVYAHISNIYYKYLDIKKIDFGHFREQNPLNEFAKQLHIEARVDYLLWKASGIASKPRAGSMYFNMCQTRVRFKRTLREYMTMTMTMTMKCFY